MFRYPWRRAVKVRTFNQYVLVGFRRLSDGSEAHTGEIGMVCRSAHWAEVECKRWNIEQQDVVWRVALISPDVPIYGKTGLPDE